MTWKKFTIKTRSEAEEVITGILASLDIFSVEIEDSVPLTDEEKAQMFVEVDMSIRFFLRGLPGRTATAGRPGRLP